MIGPPKFAHRYGYYEIRCKLPTQPDLLPAFWIQSPCIGSTLDPRVSGVEIDIMESFSRDGSVSHALHWSGYGKNHQRAGTGHNQIKPSDLSKGYHTFGVDWNAKNYVFYVDGQETWRHEGDVSDREEFILISLQYMQTPELKTAKLPDYFVVDYVRVFDEVSAE